MFKTKVIIMLPLEEKIFITEIEHEFEGYGSIDIEVGKFCSSIDVDTFGMKWMFYREDSIIWT